MFLATSNPGAAAINRGGGGTIPDFAEQFEACHRALWLLAVAVVRDHALAEDVVQEAAIVALGKLDRFEPGTSFKAWMSTMVRYVALNHARKEQKRRAAPLAEEQHAAATEPIASSEAPKLRLTDRGGVHVNRDFFDERIVTALDEVGDTARACILLRSVEGLAYREIADLLGLPEGTAMSHVHRTRQTLRRRLADFSPGDAGGGRARA